MFSTAKRIGKKFLVCLMLAALLSSTFQTNAYAGFAEGTLNSSGPREIASYDPENVMCNMKQLSFNPLGIGASDVRWELDNPTCISFMVATGTALVVANIFSGNSCENSAEAALTAADAALGVPMSPKMIKKMLKEAGVCSTLVSNCGASLGTAAPSCVKAGLCCAGVTTTIITLSIALAALGIIYAAAEGAHKSARICGHDWNSWDNVNGIMTFGKYKHSHQKYLEDKVLNNSLNFGVKNQEYREYIYGGREMEDNGPDVCPNPWPDNHALRKKVFGYE